MKLIFKRILFFLLTGFLTLQSIAQDKGLDVDINIGKKEPEWYRQPWVWVVGGAVFILLLVALLRGGKKS
ncbi:MAG: hypothetical protein ABS68_10480 [Niastella sp. SCN 39-18]|nr:hypothetical protein [Sphingobacteriales bacterium]ODT52118.1 MAG: hypothetical protein ABS68_10480 [Niastella sp. SCN 39-18]OJW11078.1 MAG: hypothetical protein BGO53_01830 [Sphingobacteriales bacterium 39-19]